MSLGELQRLKKNGIDLPSYFLCRMFWLGYEYTQCGQLKIEGCSSSELQKEEVAITLTIRMC